VLILCIDLRIQVEVVRYPSYSGDMRKTAFGKTNLQVSPVGFGGAPIGFLKTDRDRVGRLLNQLLDEGVNVIDTAAMYEGSEQLIGEAIGKRRQEFVLISKCGTRLPDIAAPEWSAQLITQTVDRALGRLRTDHLDVMLLHSCDLATLKKGEALQTLLQAQTMGKVRHVGYSGDNEAATWVAELPEIAVIQTSISICDQANISNVLPITRNNHIGVLAKRPIANAAWKDIHDQPGLYQSYAKAYTERLASMGIKPADLGFDGPPEQVWPEIALRFTLSQPGVNTAIIGTTNPENARMNIAFAERGPLPASSIAKIVEAFKRAEKASGSTWTGQT
jgi:aryl-alcohol dehydrogenase-like predicted oxidoreductase